MKRIIIDQAKAQTVAKRVGAWDTLVTAIGEGKHGLLAAEGWIFAFDEDGRLIAAETSDPVEQGFLTALLAAQIDGHLQAEFPMPSWPVTH